MKLNRIILRGKMDKPNYCFYAKVKRVVDADTIDLVVDCGFGIFRNERIRLAHVNAWEVRGEEREQGLLAKEYVEKLLPVGRTIVVKTGKEKGKYGRYIGEIITSKGDLGQLLVENGHARYQSY
jgi:micrococcal nuclease